MVMGTDVRGLINIQYSDGREGKLIPDAPGWTEISDKEWFKALKERKEEPQVEEKDAKKAELSAKDILKFLD